MYEQRELLERLIESMEIKANSLRTMIHLEDVVDEMEANEVDEVRGAISELESQIHALHGYIDQLEDYGRILMDYEIPF